MHERKIKGKVSCKQNKHNAHTCFSFAPNVLKIQFLNNFLQFITSCFKYTLSLHFGITNKFNKIWHFGQEDPRS